MSDALKGLIARPAASLAIEEAMSDTRVVLLQGARQVGKSTLARAYAARHPGTELRFLDDPTVLAAAQRDPIEFLRHDRAMVIDEIQRAPELFLAMKAAVDAAPAPGRFLLTGSAGVLAMRHLPDALTGRMSVIDLWPLSQGEIEAAGDGFVGAAFDGCEALSISEGGSSKADYADRVVCGGFPEALRRSTVRRRADFHGSYLRTLQERDVVELSRIERVGDLERLIRVLAARTAQVFVSQNAAQDAALPRRTLDRYVALLERVFLVYRIPAWSNNLTKRATSHAKMAFVDSGLAAHVLGAGRERLVGGEGPSGALFETFVLGELSRQCARSYPQVRINHYRTRDGVEVDAVLERADGAIVGIEVKSGSTVRASDARGLEHLRALLGDRFAAGYILHTGAQALPFGDRINAVPLSALWETTSRE